MLSTTEANNVLKYGAIFQKLVIIKSSKSIGLSIYTVIANSWATSLTLASKMMIAWF